MSIRPPSHYDKAYFDKWYRHPEHRVKSRLDIDRQLRFIVSATEYILERPVTRVLDVGAGEGTWGLSLKRIRPGARYYGIDPSEYAVKRYGRRRNIQLGGFGDIEALDLPDDFDLILCCGVMNYVSDEELEIGLKALTRLAVGTAYFEVFSSVDNATGDFTRSAARPPAWWRSLFRRAGWEALGLHLYLRRDMSGLLTALERAR